jgi:hypothetical protein
MTKKSDVVFVKNYKPQEKPLTDRYNFGSLKTKENATFVLVGEQNAQTLRSKINLDRIKWEGRTGNKYSVAYIEYEGKKAFKLQIKELSDES